MQRNRSGYRCLEPAGHGAGLVVICCGRIDEHTACLARGPVALMEDDFKAQPGRAAAVREWNRRATHFTYTEYVTTPAESVAGIAARQLGDQERWIEIRDLNALHHPDIGPHDYYPVGTKLLMPAKQ